MQSSSVLESRQAIAAGIIAKKGDASFKSLTKDANNDSYTFDFEGGPAMVNYAHFDGLTVAKYQEFFENFAAYTM